MGQGTAKSHATPQPERPLLPRQPRFHPIKALARRMPYRSSLAIDDPSPLLPSRGTVRAFSGSRHLLRPLQTSAARSARLSLRPVGVGHSLAPTARQISQGKTQNVPRVDAGFIKHAPWEDGGLRCHVPARPERVTPQIRFVYIAPRFRIGLPSDPASRRRPCPSPSLRLLLYLASGLSPDEFRAMPGTHVAFSRALQRVGCNAKLDDRTSVMTPYPRVAT